MNAGFFFSHSQTRKDFNRKDLHEMSYARRKRKFIFLRENDDDKHFFLSGFPGH